MKKFMATTLVAGLVATVASAEVSTTFDFANAYVFRGVTFNDEAVFQPGIEATGLGLPEEYGAITVGAWGNYDIGDYGGAIASSEFSEVDWYASYSLPTLVEGLDVFVGYTEYTYPTGGFADKEANVGVGTEVAGVALGATAYIGVGGAVHSSMYYEFTAEYGFDISEDLSGSVGASAAYLDPESGESGFNDGSLSAGLSYVLNDVWSAGASATYIAQLDDDVLTDAAYDVEVVGMLSLAAAF